MATPFSQDMKTDVLPKHRFNGMIIVQSTVIYPMGWRFSLIIDEPVAFAANRMAGNASPYIVDVYFKRCDLSLQIMIPDIGDGQAQNGRIKTDGYHL